MPVLARLFEAEGFSTIMVSNMPYWSEKVGVPRTLAVEFPFGHILGQPGNRDMQMRVIREALDVLVTADEPETVFHSDEPWPTSEEEAHRISHAETPPPIADEMGRYIFQFLRGIRRHKR